MQYQLVTDTQTLAAFCQRASTKAFIAVDTEFVRTRTLYPQLGLIQLFDGEQLLLVDPLADIQLAPLAELLTNPAVIKVLHSCSEDLETFQTALGVMPAPLFDTQLALSFLDRGNSVGYARMIEEMLSISVDKGESRTDWLARPLSDKQLDYAAKDVLYLYRVYPKLAADVDAAGKTAWLFDEVTLMQAKKRASLPSEYAYLTFKNCWKLRPKNLATLRALAKWRQELARNKNIALNFIVRESNLYEVAWRLPAKRADLFTLHGMTPQEIRRYGESILGIVADIQQLPPELYPPRVEQLTDFTAYKAMAKSIRQVCEEVATAHGLPVELFASRKQIHQVLKWQWFELDETRLSGLQPDLLMGWRKSLLNDALAHLFDDRIKPV